MKQTSETIKEERNQYIYPTMTDIFIVLLKTSKRIIIESFYFFCVFSFCLSIIFFKLKNLSIFTLYHLYDFLERIT